MMAASYLIASILPEFVYEKKSFFENKNIGISLDIKSHGLPIGFLFCLFLFIKIIMYISVNIT